MRSSAGCSKSETARLSGPAPARRWPHSACGRPRIASALFERCVEHLRFYKGGLRVDATND